MSYGRWMTYPSKLYTRQNAGVKKLQLFYAKAEAFALHADILVFVVHGLFEVKRGECIGIIVEGKSTLLKMLNGDFMLDKGKVDAGYFTQC